MCDNVFIPVEPSSQAAGQPCVKLWADNIPPQRRFGLRIISRNPLDQIGVVCNVLHVEGKPPLLIFGIICGCCWSDGVQSTGSQPAWDKAKNSADGITVQLCWAGMHLAHKLAGKNAECVL